MLHLGEFRRMMEARFGKMMARRQNTARSFFAMLCLIAVFLLYAPLGGAAWYVYSGACCTTGQCPIHGHHSSHSPATHERALDCGHETPSVASCNMSCCHDPDRPALTPVIFLLPAVLTISPNATFEPFLSLPGSPDSPNSTEPLSPPPRSFAASA